MRRKSWFARISASLIGLVVAAQLWAFPEAARETKTACVACHTNVAGGAELTEGGKAFKAEKKAPAAATAKAAEYVGSAKCKMCHIAQHKAWAETPHAKALTNLKAADPAKATAMATKLKIEMTGTAAGTEACVKCHVTGFQLAGGYPAADSVKTAAVAAVGCESCHGPGSLHVTAPMAEKKKFISKTASANMCIQCHTPAISPEFKFEEMVKKGVHPKKTG